MNGGHRAQLLRPPVAVRTVAADTSEDLDLSSTPSAPRAPYRTAIVICLRDGRPVGEFVLAVDETQRIPAETLRAAFATGFQPASPRIAASGPVPSISVVINTCAQPQAVLRGVRSVLACEPGPLEVLVVENRPDGSPVQAALEQAFDSTAPVRYVAEPRVGLSPARNAGLAAARGDVVAFTDDDVEVDAAWLRWIGAAFASEPDAACVTGLILPADLESSEQLRMEQFAGFGKGYERRVFRASEQTSPLFPFAAGEFGSGANTALRADVARALGGFEPSLGAGTPARGGEDLDLYVRVLIAGYALVYEPAAMIHHHHPPGIGRLRREVFGYGVSLTAMLAKQVADGYGPAIARRAGAGLKFVRDPDSRKNVRKPADYSRSLDWLERVGMAFGPAAFALSRRRARRAGGVSDDPPYRPTWVGELQLADPLPPVAVPPRDDGGRYDRARLLVRRGSSVLGFISVPARDGAVPADALEQAVAGLRADAADLEPVAAGAARPGRVSIIVCTYDRPAGLSRTLSSILRVDWDEFEVVVVDNAPDRPGTRTAVQELGDARIRYVPEPVPGLSAARNRGVAAALGEIVAFTDDDVVVDRGWLRALAAGFERGPRVACVTGLVPAGELDTAYQAYFDDKVKWSETLHPRLYDLGANRGPSPLFPYANGDVGAGANFAVRRSVFESVGDFDEALGAGSPAEGGEDLDFFARLLLGGWQIAFEPGAIVWHEHRRDRRSLRSQMHGYGAGLTAYACKHLLFGRAAPAVVAALVADRQNGPRARELPPIMAEIPEMRIAELRGMLAGPWAYVRGRRGVRARAASGR